MRARAGLAVLACALAALPAGCGSISDAPTARLIRSRIQRNILA